MVNSAEFLSQYYSLQNVSAQSPFQMLHFPISVKEPIL